MPTIKPKTIDEYIDVAPPESREMLEEIRTLLKEVAPNATEAIKWGNPVLEEKRILFSFSAHKDHVTFMPTRTTLKHFMKEVSDYKTGQDTVQFPYGKPLPKALIKKMAEYRVKEVAEGSLWMHHEGDLK